MINSLCSDSVKNMKYSSDFLSMLEVKDLLKMTLGKEAELIEDLTVRELHNITKELLAMQDY